MLSRIRRTLVVVAAVASTLSGVAASQQPVIRGNARFEVLSPNLIRMEYSHEKRFVNAARVAVQNRHGEAVEFHARDSEGWLEISTAKMRLRYRLGSGAFGATNLTISWSDGQGEHRWKPGDKDNKNLGGVPGDIALRATPGAEIGPLSRNGYFFLDDSHTAVWNRTGDWVEPRVDKNGQDWYFFVYGHDFKGMLRELSQLLGAIPMIPRYLFRPDFKAWTSRILAAFVDHPFESNRTIPELDSDAVKSTRLIENAAFSPEKIGQMTATLLGCVVAAKASGDPSPTVVGRLDYDSESMPGGQVSYEMSFPNDNPPGWGEISRTLDDQHFIHFEIQAPFPPRPGAHFIRVRATLKGNGGQTEVTRDVHWMSSGNSGS